MPAVPNETTVVLGDWQTHIAKARRRASGKERTTLEIKSDLTIADLDPKRLAQGVAVALADAVRKGIQEYGGFVSAATEDFRERAAKAYTKGARWAKKRYAGGRIGAMEPFSKGIQMLNDSGRLAKSVIARLARGGANDDEAKWTYNVAANRLTQDQPAFRLRMLNLLAPILAAATVSPEVQQAIVGSAQKAVQVGKGKSLQELLRATLEGFKTAQELGGAAEEFSEEPPER